MFYASCTSTQNICKMHFGVGIIVPFVRITKLTVVLLKANTAGESDPLNPVKTQSGPDKGADCVGEQSTQQVCFSPFSEAQSLKSRTRFSGVGSFCRGFPRLHLTQGLENWVF